MLQADSKLMWRYFVLHSITSPKVDSILQNLDIVKAAAIDQITLKFLKDGAPVIPIHIAIFINMLIKLDTFPLKYKRAKKPLWKRVIKTKSISYRPIYLLHLILKVIEKLICNQI